MGLVVGKVIMDKSPWHIFGGTGRDLFQLAHRPVQGGGHGTKRRLLFHLCLPAHLERDLHRLDQTTRRSPGNP